MRNRLWSLGILVAMLLVACGPVAQQVETPAPTVIPTATPSLSSGDGIDGYAELIDALREEGAVVDPAGEVEQPFFSVDGRLIEVDGASVQVFEYDDQSAREAESSLISADGQTVGETSIMWIDQPNFRTAGRLIVLYVGSDEAIIGLLDAVLGGAVIEEEALPPYAVILAWQTLSDMLGVPAHEIEIVSYEYQEWTDSCLGLGGANESCLQAITPGWRVVLYAVGQEWVYRTDELGEAVRLEGSSLLSEGDGSTVIARGEFLGIDGHLGAGTASLVQLSDESVVLRLEGFAVSDGPDLYVYLVSEAEPTGSADFGDYVDLGLLQSNDGDQEYTIPDGVDLGNYRSAVIYCLEYDVLFAGAKFAN